MSFYVIKKKKVDTKYQTTAKYDSGEVTSGLQDFGDIILRHLCLGKKYKISLELTIISIMSFTVRGKLVGRRKTRNCLQLSLLEQASI